ncbi:MAG: Fic family protein [Deltaproteobacteria bacterium]|jgi:Fic family protein|nr:Fic family protein [Deltaproteobacteria bacterium]MBW2534673.1 Fic family protein [Deltaproteobacteria bacterium]
MPRPPFHISSTILRLCGDIQRELGRLEGIGGTAPQPRLRRNNRIRTIHGTLAIEGNTLTLDQVTDVLDGVRVAGPRRDIIEVRNANLAYQRLVRWKPTSAKALLRAHGLMMKNLIDDAGRWRARDVGVLRGTRVAHVAPPAHRVPDLMVDLFRFVQRDTELPWLVQACVFHYELEFIHPFSDGNGRMGRLWQQVICVAHEPVFEHLPVESVVREDQATYYEVLAECDQAGESSRFAELMLGLVHRALKQLVAEVRPVALTATTRIERALDRLGRAQFSRKEYLALFPTLSAATASRDLRRAVERGLLVRSGDKATARYRRA